MLSWNYREWCSFKPEVLIQIWRLPTRSVIGFIVFHNLCENYYACSPLIFSYFKANKNLLYLFCSDQKSRVLFSLAFTYLLYFFIRTIVWVISENKTSWHVWITLKCLVWSSYPGFSLTLPSICFSTIVFLDPGNLWKFSLSNLRDKIARDYLAGYGLDWLQVSLWYFLNVIQY